MKVEIRNRWTGDVQFAVDVDIAETAPNGERIGAAVIRAITTGANLNGANLNGASLVRARLVRARLVRASLDGANLNGANLVGANLNGASLDDARLVGASLVGARLDGANLVGARLDRASLDGANLDGANLDGANLVDGAHFGDDIPVIKDIHSAMYKAASQPDALEMSQWHCGTAHCRAGWVVTLAGEAGRALENRIGTAAAACAIYFASDPTMTRVPDFYCDNDTALADMRAMAEGSK